MTLRTRALGARVANHFPAERSGVTERELGHARLARPLADLLLWLPYLTSLGGIAALVSTRIFR